MKQILACFGCWSQSSSPLSQIFGENGLRSINFNWGWGKTTEISWIIMSNISNDHIVDPLSGWMSPWWWPCILIWFGSWLPKDEFGSHPTVTSKLEQKKQTRWGFVGCLSIVHQCRSHGAQIYVNQGSLDYQFWKDCNSEKFPLYLDLFNGDFHFFTMENHH